MGQGGIAGPRATDLATAALAIKNSVLQGMQGKREGGWVGQSAAKACLVCLMLFDVQGFRLVQCGYSPLGKGLCTGRCAACIQRHMHSCRHPDGWRSPGTLASHVGGEAAMGSASVRIIPLVLSDAVAVA